MAYYRSTVLVSMDPVCIDKGALEIKEQLIKELALLNLSEEVQVLDSPRLGDPDTEGPDILVYPEASHYIQLTTASIVPIVLEHFVKGRELQQYKAQMRDVHR